MLGVVGVEAGALDVELEELFDDEVEPVLLFFASRESVR